VEEFAVNLSHRRRSAVRLFAIACALAGCFPFYPSVAQTLPQQSPPKQTQPSLNIPVGTILPVRFDRGLSSKSAKAGQTISARVMQDVPLPNNGIIPAGAKLSGSIVSVAPAAAGGSGKISFRFDRLIVHKQSFPLVASLRAMAGFVEVLAAQTPEVTPDFGTPYNWTTRRQIGGDEVYGVGGPVTDEWSHHVGTAVNGGVLVHVRARPGTKCRGALDEADRLQALWVFSSDACGVYGMEGVTIAHAGRSEPTGEIALAATQGELRVRDATAMLLRVLR
jgi:hypothetical protein